MRIELLKNVFLIGLLLGLANFSFADDESSNPSSDLSEEIVLNDEEIVEDGTVVLPTSAPEGSLESEDSSDDSF